MKLITTKVLKEWSTRNVMVICCGNVVDICLAFGIQLRPGIALLNKADHLRIRTTFSQSHFDPIHIMYYHIQKAD